MSGLYVEAGDLACCRKKINVTINGKKVKWCVRAKSGRNGFVEMIDNPPRAKNCEIVSRKMRGNVKISMSPK